jgi:hypothetical protein
VAADAGPVTAFSSLRLLGCPDGGRPRNKVPCHTSAMMQACEVDLDAPKEHLVSYIDNDLKTLMTDDDESLPTAAFQRVMPRRNRANDSTPGRSR